MKRVTERELRSREGHEREQLDRTASENRLGALDVSYRLFI